MRVTLGRMVKVHSKPVLISILLVLFWILLWRLSPFEYEHDPAFDFHSDCGSDHRRILEDVNLIDDRRVLATDATDAVVETTYDPHATDDHTEDTHTDDTHTDDTHDDSHDDSHLSSEITMEKLPDEAYLVAATLSVAVVFLLMEYPGWIVMICSGAFLTLTGTITETDMWHAMSFPTLIACCSVTAVAKGLANTHIMSRVMEKILDFDNGDFTSLSMLFLITGLVSTVVDNFAVIGIFQYVYTVFSKRTGIPLKVMMMPLSFISMIGGTVTVLASGAMLVAKSFLEEETTIDYFPHITSDQKDLTMFEMTIASFPVLLVSAPLLAWWCTYLFDKNLSGHGDEISFGSDPDAEQPRGSGSSPKENKTEKHHQEHGHGEHGFIMKYKIGPTCKIQHIHKLDHASYLWKEVRSKKKKCSKGLVHINHDTDVKAGDTTYILAPGRKIHDLACHGYELMELNTERNHEIILKDHVIAEGIVDPHAHFVGKKFSEVGKYIRHWHVIGIFHTDPTYPRPSVMHDEIRGGDILLLEGEAQALHENHRGFLQIADACDSDHHHDIYTFQLIVSGLCLLMIIICTVLGVLSLLQTVIISLLILVQTQCLSIEEMLHKFKWRVLLLITGAYAIAHAFVETMLAEFLTQKLLQITEKELPMLLILYVMALILGLAFPPKAQIGILYPICLTLAQKSEALNLKKMIIVVLQGTAIQFLTPNNPENSLVSDGYTFADFFTAGLPMALVSGLIFIPLFELTYGIL